MILPLKTFFFARHGQTIWNAKCICTGSTDVPLTDYGRRQAKEKQDIVKKLNIDKIFYSPLVRAYETAVIFNEKAGLPMVPYNSLQEWSLGEWEGIDENTFVNTILKLPVDHIPANGESKKQFYNRAIKGISGVLSQRVTLPLIVAHGGLFWALQDFLGINHGYIDNGAIAQFIPVSTAPARWKIQLVHP